MLKALYSVLLVVALVGCAAPRDSGSRPSLVSQETTVRPPAPAVKAISPGSLMPAVGNSQTSFRGLFEERRVSRVGDTLTVILNETTKASKNAQTAANRKGTSAVNFGLRTNAAIVRPNNNQTNRADIGASASSDGNVGFDGKGSATASNQFSGTITVTVLEVLPNGNLVVAGEKRLAVGAEEEIIKFSGVVSPLSIKGNSVLSSQVADVRAEYRGSGSTDEIQRPGWLTRFLMAFAPN